jgi:hypothetical protein
MTIENQYSTQYKYAKIAGFSYVVFTLFGAAKNFFLNTNLSELDDIATSGYFVSSLGFRLGIAAEILMFIFTLIASIAFFIVLKPLNKPLAFVTLGFRLAEVILGCVAVIASMAMLALTVKLHLSSAFEHEQLRQMLLAFSSLRMPAYELSFIFMGVAGNLTFYLFYKHMSIPKAWCFWGFVTYSSMMLYTLVKLAIPDLPREVQLIMLPGALFELTVGVWLVTKGITLKK